MAGDLVEDDLGDLRKVACAVGVLGQHHGPPRNQRVDDRHRVALILAASQSRPQKEAKC